MANSRGNGSGPAQTVNPENKTGFGTFGGVFTPSILTILGVIMYLRFGWVVGNVGLLGTLLIVTLSTLITFFTALSIASIATDQRVRAGGAYYMISRSMGIETGGAVGIPLYLAQALSVALYTIGFAESFSGVFPQFDQTSVGLIVTLVVGVLAIFSAKIAIRSQYFIMAAIAISLISLAFGKPIEETTIEMWGATDRNSEPFWVVFAVFFPAVTGIMAGVNMSGDLKDSAKSIPKGTFAAIGVGYLIYMGLPILLANRANALTLIDDPLIMRKIAYWGDAILLGVWGATLSSAIGSILGAPRVLQALARDSVLPRKLRWLGRGTGDDDSPRIGTIVTLALALVAVYFGNLNVVAPVLTMFFLTTYGVLNIAAGLERFLGSPSFRPTFKVHWVFSLLGAFGCIAVMLLINALATVAALLFILLVFFWLQKRKLQTAWGDVRQGVWMAMVRAGLMRIKRNADPKNWRPHILVLSGAPTKRWHLIELANSLSQSKAIMTVCTTITDPDVPVERQNAMEARISEYLFQRGISSLVRVFSSPDPFEGSKQLVDTYGLGQMVPNTIVLGASENEETKTNYCEMISHFYRSQRNVLVVRENETEHKIKNERIDIWWGGLKANGGLMIVLAFLLQNSLDWQNAQINLKMLTTSENAAQGARKNLENIVGQMRIDVNTEVICDSEQDFYSILHQSSQGADLIFLGMAEPTGEFDFVNYFSNMQLRTADLPTIIFTLASEDIVYEDVLS
ncbi:APC family permease [Halocola ammonii]